MALPLWTVLVVTFGLIWFLRRKFFKKESELIGKELPGPKGLPIVGCLFQLGVNPNEQFCKWTEEYGDIYKVDLGSYTSVIVSDPKLAKEMFSAEPAFAGRVSSPVFEMYPDEPGLGIVNAENERWEVHRRFLLRQLRDFGFGKSTMEALIMDDVSEVIKKFKEIEGQPVKKINEVVKLAVVNSLWGILSSQILSHDDPKLIALARNSSDGFNETVEKGSLVDYLPFLRHIIPEYSGYNAVRKVFHDVRTFMEETIEQHKLKFQDGDKNCFLDVYFNEMKEAENDPASFFHGSLAERQLIATLFDLFLAGSETTSTTLAWAVFYLCKYPKVQEKLQQEINDVTGDTRNVSVNDRPSMPYTVALIDEVLRCSSIIASGVEHRAMADREFKGYHIPKDAALQPNLYFIHHNPKIWGDPENFRPERFLTADGKKYVKSENLQPFQIGRRQCPGETLARDNVFLFMTNIFQQFKIKFDPDMKIVPGLEGHAGAIRTPAPHSVIMRNRL